MSTQHLAPPSPEVLYLPALFRRIQQGDLRVPAFQREFVWVESQVLDLLESVYKGYPIGSLLFWRVDNKVLKVEDTGKHPFPLVKEKYPLSYILDGLQRLSSLYGVFHWGETSQAGMFNVVFDLATEEFLHFGDEAPPTSIRLSLLFSPRELISEQKRLASLEDGELLLDRTVSLHARFQEYLVPVVTIVDQSVERVVSIFERVNSTGTKLDAVDFMRALTWSQRFDLNKEIDRLAVHFAEKGYVIPAETFVKMLAITLGHEPTPASMLGLRSYKPATLRAAVKRSQKAIQKAVDFLRSRFRVLSYDYIPYEGQLLVLANFFLKKGVPSDVQLQALERWYWAVSFNEELRGKPDHYVTRLLKRSEALADGDQNALQQRLTISATDFIERRFIQNKALSSAVATLFAVNGARSLATGSPIPLEDYMTEFSGSNYVGLVGPAELSTALKRKVITNKILANIVLASPSDAKRIRDSSPGDPVQVNGLQAVDEDVSVFQSQLIPPQAVHALKAGDYKKFILERADYLMKCAEQHV